MLPPNDKLAICFAHLAYQLHERFSALNAGINSFAVRDPETLENRVGEADVLVISHESEVPVELREWIAPALAPPAVSQARMQPHRIIPTLDVAEAGHLGLGLGCEPAAAEQLGLQGGEEALGHGVVVGVTDGPH